MKKGTGRGRGQGTSFYVFGGKSLSFLREERVLLDVSCLYKATRSVGYTKGSDLRKQT